MVESNALAVLALAAVIFAILADVQSDVRRMVSARNMGLSTIAAWFIYEAVLMPAEVAAFRQDQYNFAVCMILVCLASGLAVYHGSKGGVGVFDDFSKRLYQSDDPRFLWKVFLVGLAIGVAPLLFAAEFDIYYVISSAFQYGKRWSDRFTRARYGGLRDAFMEFQMFLKAAVPVAVVLIASKRTSPGKRVFCVGFLIWMVSRAAVSGTRSTLLLVALPILAAVYWHVRPQTQKLGILVGIPLLVLLGVLWSAAVVKTRESGEFQWYAAGYAEYVGFEMFRELLYLTVNVPDPLEYRFGHTYYVQAVNPIPRAFWPGKPIADAGLLMARARGEIDANGEPYLTRSPGLIGEFYWNFGLPGVVVLSGLCGFLLKAWDRVVFQMRQSLLTFVVFAAGLAIIFLSGRSITMGVCYGMISFYLLLIIMKRVSPTAGRNPPERSGTVLAANRRQSKPTQ